MDMSVKIVLNDFYEREVGIFKEKRNHSMEVRKGNAQGIKSFKCDYRYGLLLLYLELPKQTQDFRKSLLLNKEFISDLDLKHF